jgi:hypothetical protein
MRRQAAAQQTVDVLGMNAQKPGHVPGRQQGVGARKAGALDGRARLLHSIAPLSGGEDA